MKKCKVCCKIKELCEFYKSKSNADGHSSLCKDCYKIKYKEYYKKNIEKERLRSKKYTDKNRLNTSNREKIILINGETYYQHWYKENKNNVNIRNKEWRDKNTLKTKAHYIVKKNIRNVLISKPSKCMSCCLEKRLESHHNNYDKPLDIIWLCRSCHRRYHDSDDSSFKEYIDKLI